MPVIAVKPITLNNIDLKLGTDNYEAHVNKARLVPTTPVTKWKGMTPGSAVNMAGDPEWVLELSFAQDHETANSMSLYLMANIGKIIPFALKPVKPVGPATAATYSGNVLVLPGPVGGDLDTTAVGDVSLPVNGQPTRAAA